MKMNCPYCNSENTEVYDENFSVVYEKYYQCLQCHRCFVQFGSEIIKFTEV